MENTQPIHYTEKLLNESVEIISKLQTGSRLHTSFYCFMSEDVIFFHILLYVKYFLYNQETEMRVGFVIVIDSHQYNLQIQG